MPFARLSLSAIAAGGLSLALGSAPAQAQYADDPPNAYDRPAPGYYPQAAGPAYAPAPGDDYARSDGYGPPREPYYASPPAYAGRGPEVGEVIIIAPRYHRREIDPATGAPIERVSTSRRVAYDDLDLTTEWGVRALRHRIERAANDACDSLERHFDVLDSGDNECAARAVREAMRQAPIGYGSDAAYEGR